MTLSDLSPEPTTWEKFAREKGIGRFKKALRGDRLGGRRAGSRLSLSLFLAILLLPCRTDSSLTRPPTAVFDEPTKEWRPRFGAGRALRPEDDWVQEVHLRCSDVYMI
jgi:hypothetical protein